MRCLRLVLTLAVLCCLTGDAFASYLLMTDPVPPAARALGNVHIGTTANAVVKVRSCKTGSNPCANDGSDTPIDAVSLGASCGGKFTVTPPAALPIVVQSDGTEVTFAVAYTPTTRVNDTCVVTFVAGGNDLDTTVTLTGTGTASHVTVTSPAGGAPLQFALQSHNGGTGETKTITILNDGNETIAAANISAAIPANPDFVIGAVVGTPIAPAGSGTVAVTFNPGSVGAKMGTVTFTVTNDLAADPNPTVTVQGTGTQSMLSAPAAVVFASGAVGVARNANLTITNTGDGPLTISTMTISSAPSQNGTDFAFTDHGCSGQICASPGVISHVAGMNTTTFAIRCTPGAAGLRGAIMTIASDDGTTGTRDVALKCTGNNLVSFGNDRPGGAPTATKNVTVTNASAASITYSVASNAAAEFIVACPVAPAPGCANRMLASGASETVTVAFQASTTGLRNGTLTFNTTDPDIAPGNINNFVSLSGVGVEPAIAAAPSPLAFGNVPVPLANGATTNLTISNMGTDTLNVMSMSIVGDMGNVYSFANAVGCTTGHDCLVPFMVNTGAAPANQATVTVRCDPTMPGAVMGASLTIISDAPTSPTSVALTCIGTAPMIAAAPSPLAFGNVPVDLVNGSTQGLVVTNGGDAPLNISAMTITGADPMEFSFATAACVSGQTCNAPVVVNTGAPPANQGTITLRCDPTTGGAKMATLTITSDAATSPTMIALTCTGTVPTIAAAPNPLAFGTVPVALVNGTTQGLVVSNGGLAPLNVTSMTITGADPTQFSFATAGCLVGQTCNVPFTVNPGMAPANQTTVTVRCDPTTPGMKMATLTITSNAATSPTMVMLTCTGTRPVATLTAPVPATPPTDGGVLAFGDVLNNTTSAPARTITLMNSGDATLAVTGVTNTNLAAFELVGPATTTITAGMSQSWTVVCDPEVRGLLTGKIMIANDSVNDTSVDVDLTCNSTEAVFAVTASNPVPLAAGTINFGGVPLTTSVMTVVTVTNTGNVPGTIHAINLASNMQGFSVSGFVADTVVAGAMTTQFTVVFAPTQDAQGTTVITVDSDMWNDPTFTVTGDGLPTGVGIMPNPVAFGNVRWDQMADQVITVTNTAAAPFTVTGATLSGAGAGEFQVIGFVAGPLNGMGQNLAFTVRANPTDAMLGARAAVLTITTTLPGLAQSTPVALSYTSVGPMVSLTPGMTVDFGDVDVDNLAGRTINLVVTNTGSGQLTVSNFGTIAPGVFTKSNPGVTPFSILTTAPNNTATIPITFRPTMERAEQTTFTITTTGMYVGGAQGPNSILVTLTGRGVDQHIQVGDVVFPPTYRDPTDAQVPTTTCGVAMNQPCVVTICNTGTAALTVSMVTDADDAFTLGDTAGVALEPGSVATPTCKTRTIEFRPPRLGNFEGTLTVFNDDNARPMAEVRLSGSGILRPVTVMPSSVERISVAIDTPIRLSDLVAGAQGLVLANSSAADGFDVDLRLSGDVTIATLLGPVTALAPASSATYDLQLDTGTAGDFEVVVDVFLDDDDEQQATLTIPLRVVNVDLHGGGCDGGGGGAGAMVGFAALGLLGFGRRRRLGLSTLAVLAMVGAGGGVARAQTERGELDISTFTPVAATEPGMFTVLSPRIARSGAWSLDLAFHVEQNPLVADETDADGMVLGTAELITRRTSVDLGFAYALSRRLELGLDLPLHNQDGCTTACMSGDAPSARGVSGASGMTLGDVALRAKANLVPGATGFGAALTITAPTAKEGSYAGSRGPTAHLQALIGVAAGARLGLAFNGGLRARQSSEVLGVAQGTELTYGAAGSLRALDKVWVIGEAYGGIGIIGAEGKVSPAQFALGVRYRAGQSLMVGVGGGGGIFGQSMGSPDFRGFISLALVPGARPLEPLTPPPPPPPPVDTRDDDGDGILNTADKCTAVAEDQDDWEDDDGCPDPDNDGDGVADGADKCPSEPEDKDGTDDGDGCVDRDDDGDGIADVDDRCPKEPEDKDGFNDNDGCDDADNDKDGVIDLLDQCALEPETINGNNDDDGCPDQGDALVMVMQDRIEALEPITFSGTTAKLTKGAQNVLQQIGATLRADQTIKKIRITVHTHPRNDNDQALSDRRAEEIRKVLLQTGVEPERLDARGIGSQRPLVKPSAKGAEQINDRVEFIIFERRTESAPKPPGKPPKPTTPTTPAPVDSLR